VASQQEVLFYDAKTRAAATAVIDDGGVLRELQEMDAGSFGAWTHIVA
jgi:hypothetical protein